MTLKQSRSIDGKLNSPLYTKSSIFSSIYAVCCEITSNNVQNILVRSEICFDY